VSHILNHSKCPLTLELPHHFEQCLVSADFEYEIKFVVQDDAMQANAGTQYQLVCSTAGQNSPHKLVDQLRQEAGTAQNKTKQIK
jgi:hypothetical protein